MSEAQGIERKLQNLTASVPANLFRALTSVPHRDGDEETRSYRSEVGALVLMEARGQGCNVLQATGGCSWYRETPFFVLSLREMAPVQEASDCLPYHAMLVPAGGDPSGNSQRTPSGLNSCLSRECCRSGGYLRSKTRASICTGILFVLHEAFLFPSLESLHPVVYLGALLPLSSSSFGSLVFPSCPFSLLKKATYAQSGTSPSRHDLCRNLSNDQVVLSGHLCSRISSTVRGCAERPVLPEAPTPGFLLVQRSVIFSGVSNHRILIQSCPSPMT